MATSNSQASFEQAGRQASDSVRHSGDGFAEIGKGLVDWGSAIGDAWGAQFNVLKGGAQATGEGLAGAGAAIGRTVDAAGAELARENRDVARAVQAAGDTVAGAAHAVVQGVDVAASAVGQAGIEFSNGYAAEVHAEHQELDRKIRMIGEAASAVADAAQAGANRIGDHYRDRPLMAAMEGPLAPIDGLMRGGIAPGDKTPVQGDSSASQADARPSQGDARTQTGARTPHQVATADNSPEARPPVAGADQNRHQVRSGESYWSIAAAQGGTNAAILARSQHLQAVNHGRDLLPNLEIVMS